MYEHPLVSIAYIFQIQLLQIPVAQLLNTVCEGCNIDLSNFEETRLKYSSSAAERSVYFTTELIYSNFEGTITSSTIISMLLSWFQLQVASTLDVAGQSVALSKICSTSVNTSTQESCSDYTTNPISTSYVSTAISISTSYEYSPFFTSYAVATSSATRFITRVVVPMSLLSLMYYTSFEL